MNRSDPVLCADTAHPTLAELERYKREAHRLRTRYIGGLAVRLAVGLDRLLRRAAARLARVLVREAKPCR